MGAVLLGGIPRRYVNYSLMVLYGSSTLAPGLSAAAVFLLNPIWGSLSSLGSLLGKSGVIAGVCRSAHWITEREQLRRGWELILERLRLSNPGSP